MAANVLVQTRIDADIRDRASAVLEGMGLTLSDAVRILLTRTANKGALPLELVADSRHFASMPAFTPLPRGGKRPFHSGLRLR